MKMIPWKSQSSHPALLFDDIERDMENLMGSFFGRGFNGGDWHPRLDVRETKDSVVVKADIPGMEKKDIQLSVENGVLSISGERKHEEEKEEGGYKRLERSYGSFSRSVSLPSGVDESAVKAEYKNGELTVTLPKTEKSRTKTISIQ